MEEITYKAVFHYIQQSIEPVSPHELSRVTGKSRVSVHTALKKLLANGDIEKRGVSPKARYTIKRIEEIIPADLTVAEIKAKTAPILKKYPVAYAGILGTFEDETVKAGSTINMMISCPQPLSLVALGGIERALNEALGMKVDLITDQGANKYIKSSMLHSLKIVYGTL